ncbi:MAG: nuclear transport factor 2 family protein [Sneathiella sp.]
MMETTLAKWHKIAATKDVQGLSKILHEDAIFHSPVVHTPQKGKALTQMYLTAAFHVLTGDDFKYVREVVSGNNAVLEFETIVDGITINGVDMITCDDDGLIVDFKVMVRPLKAMNMLHQKMMAMLEQHNKAS